MDAAVFIDRDATLVSGDEPKRVRLTQGAASAIASLCGLGYKIVVVSEQGGSARGRAKAADVDAMHRRIRDAVQQASNGARIDGFYDGPPRTEGRGRGGRKPPVPMRQAAGDLKLDLKQSWTLGDQIGDIAAGAAVGTRTILVRSDVDRLTPDELSAGRSKSKKPDFTARNLIEAVRIIAQQRKPETVRHPENPPAAKRWDAAAVAELQRPRTEVVVGEPAEEPAAADAAAVTDAPPVTEPEPAFEPQADVEEVEEEEYEAEQEQPEQDEADSTYIEPVASAASDKTLRLIHQELRNLRGADADFSYLRVMAIVLQMIALLCLLGAFWMGAGDQEMFIRWIAAGVLVQLATIALLLFSR